MDKLGKLSRELIDEIKRLSMTIETVRGTLVTELRKPTRGLAAAMKHVYTTFEIYPLRPQMRSRSCTCGCVTAGDIRQITRHPLKRLRGDGLRRYAAKAMTTFGDVDDFRHFLPRIFELIGLYGSKDYSIVEAVFGKLTYAQWRTWPQVEQLAVEAYMMELWKHLLMSSPTRAGWDWDVDTWLCSIAQAIDDLGPFLAYWRQAVSIAPLRHLAALLTKNFGDFALYGELGSPFWRGRQDQMEQVVCWLIDPSTREQLTRGTRKYSHGKSGQELAFAIDRRTRWPAVRIPSRPQAPDSSSLNDLCNIVDRQPWPLVFATVSGAHLYGFPSRDSDYDVRGVHILPREAVLGLKPTQDTVTSTAESNRGPVDIVTHDVKKFSTLLLNRNGYVLEQVFSPLIVKTSREHRALMAIAKTCLTRGHARHYIGFAETQWKAILKTGPRVKLLLYVFRVLLTGIYLMRTGEIEANLPRLNDSFKLSYLDDLIVRKVGGGESDALEGQIASGLYEREYARLRGVLEEAALTSSLPEAPSGEDALNDLLLRVRRANLEVSRRSERSD